MDNVVTPKFRVSYPNVFKTRKNDLSGKDEYSLVALFPKGADLSKLEAAVKKCVEEKWGADPKKWPKKPDGSTALRTPIRDQSERAKQNDEGEMVLPEGYVKGAKFMNLKSERRPAVVDRNVLPILEESEFYAGCFALASIRPYAYAQKGNCGVAFGLQNVQKVGDGDPLSGATRPEEDFVAIKDEEGDTPTSANSLFQ